VRWFTPTRAVVLVAVLYAVVAAVVVGLDRQVRWDEVTFLAQVTPGAADVWFGPQRARGMTLVLAPVGLLGGSTLLLRVWLVAVHAVVMVVAFRPWAQQVGWTGVAGAAVTALSWVPLYFAVEGYPNLLVGFLAVAMAGHVLTWGREGRTGNLVVAAAALAGIALLRPAESVWLAAGLTIVVLVWKRQAAVRPILAFLAGGFVGWLPWLIEGIVRFGGPITRVEAARATSVAGEPRNSLIQYLNLVEGPVRRVVPDPVLTGPALLLLLGFAALIVLGVVGGRDRERRAAAVVAVVPAATMVVPYLLLNAGINLRYILPGMMLAAVAIGAGLVTVIGAVVRHRSRLAGTALVAVLVVHVVWQLGLARTNSDAIAPLQARPVPLGEALAEAAEDQPCAFLSNVQWPEIQWHSGCKGEVLHFDAPLLQCHDARRDLAALAEDGYRVFVLARGEPPFSSTVEGWPVEQLDEPEDGVWRLYERPAQLGPDDPPTIPDPEDSPTPCPPSRAPDTADAQLEFRWRR